MRPSQNRVYNCHNSKGIKLLKKFRVGLSHLRKHKSKDIFQDTLTRNDDPLEYSQLYCSQYFRF